MKNFNTLLILQLSNSGLCDKICPVDKGESRFKGSETMRLYDYSQITALLKRHGFTFSKALGQNFITDPEICPAMAKSLGASGDTGVLEIGPGIGVLTKELSAAAGKVAAIEADARLLPILDETLDGCGNVEIISGDAMKLDLNEIIERCFAGMKDVKVCANLPYYITSPIIMRLIESRLRISSITVMVQKEAAERLTAPVGSRLCGALTVAAQYYAEAEKLFDVSRDCFMPSPKVDSAVIRLTVRREPPVMVDSEENFFKVVRAAFSQRRKTALNCLSGALGLPKDTVSDALLQIGRSPSDRAETFSLEEFAALSRLI